MESSLLTASPRLRSALAYYQSASGARPIQIEALDGTGNRSFKITLDTGGHKDSAVVLRLNGETEFLGVNRQVEKRILETITDRGISPELKLWREDFLVVEFIESASLATPESLAQTLSTLHRIPVPKDLRVTWIPTQTIRDYLAIGGIAQAEFASQLEILDRVDWSSLDYGICHIDLNPTNILQPLTEGSARLIDWEYARYGPVAYDFGVYAETHGLSPSRVAQMSVSYPTPPNPRDIELCQFAYRLIELLWLRITSPDDVSLQQLLERVQTIQIPDNPDNSVKAR